MRTSPLNLAPVLAAYVVEIEAELAAIPTSRKAVLGELARFVERSLDADGTAALVFICSHNSRRSQMAQIWARAAAHHFGVAPIEAYSGGTLATAFEPRAVAAMRRAGFVVDEPDEGDNPVYRVRYAEGVEALSCSSKRYDADSNPTGGFGAVMTCSAADAACPVVAGAVVRFSLPYEDPGDFDGSSREQAVYDESCRQIAREMLYAFSRVNT